MSNAYIKARNRVLYETLMNSKFHKDKKNFVLKEFVGDEPETPEEAQWKQKAEEIKFKKELGYNLTPEEQSFLRAGLPQPTNMGTVAADFLRRGGHERCIPGQRQLYWDSQGNIHDRCPSKENMDEEGWTLLDVVNLCLDVIGIFDPSGIADFSNALIYAARGKFLDSFFSVLGGAIPYVGDVGKFLKIGGKISLEIIIELYKGLKAYFPQLQHTISWMKNNRIMQPVADLIEDFFHYGPEWLSKKIGKETTTELAKKIVTPKMAEASKILTLRGQKELFTKHPFLKTFELGMAGTVIYGKFAEKYNEIARKIAQHLALFEAHLKAKYEKDGIVQLVFNNKAIHIDQFIRALQINYIINVAKDDQMAAAIMDSIQIKPGDAELFLGPAVELNFISPTSKQNIYNNLVALQKKDEDNILIKAIKAIIPKFVEEAEQRSQQAKSLTAYKENQIYNTILANKAKAQQLSVQRDVEKNKQIKAAQKTQTATDKEAAEQERTGLAPVDLPWGM